MQNEINLADKMGYNYNGMGNPIKRPWPFNNTPSLLYPYFENKSNEWKINGTPHIQKNMNFDYMESYLSNLDKKIEPYLSNLDINNNNKVDNSNENNIINNIINELENINKNIKLEEYIGQNNSNIKNELDNFLYPINFNKLPKLTKCTCYYADGVPISYCNDILTFNWIRLQVKLNNVPGVWFLTDSNIPSRGTIDTSGNVKMDSRDDIPPFSEVTDVEMLINIEN